MEKRPLLSIAVPTKNRYEYLKYLIELVASFASDEIELVIQDNSDNNSEILEYINNKQAPFVKYFYRTGIISMTGNCDYAIQNCTGEYVCLIGDDDGVTRYVIDAVKWMKQNDFTILKSSFSIYKWPSFITPSYYDVKATALFNHYSLKYRIVDCKESLKKLLSSGIDSLDYMPKLYNGIVKRDVLDRIFKQTGSYSPGPSPDMANAVSLAMEEDYFVYIDAPIIIGGHSSHLGGDANKHKNKMARLEDQPIIAKKDVDNWDPRIPKIWAAMAVWPESAITALKAYNSEYIKYVDFEKIYKIFIYEHKTAADLAIQLSSEPNSLKVKSWIFSKYRFVRGCVNVLIYKLTGIYSGLHVVRNIKDIIEAERIFSSDINSFNPKFQK